MVLAKTQSTNEPQGHHFSPHSTAIKAHISGRMASIGINDVVTTSVNSEITRMKKCIMIMIITIITEKTFTS